MPNTELARRILTAIKEHPEMHDQDDWGRKTECGTTMCIAGWACHLNGDELLFDEDYRRIEHVAFMVHTKDGRTMDINIRAQELLGLDRYGCGLFFCDDEEALSELARLANGGS